MVRTELVNYLKKLPKNLPPLEEFERVFLENIDEYEYKLNEEPPDDEVLLLFEDILRLYGGILSEKDQLQKAYFLYEKNQFIVSGLYRRDKMDYLEKNSFDVMHIKCLALVNKKRKAINGVLRVYQEFILNKKKILKEIKGNRSIIDVVYILYSIKSLCQNAKAWCNQVGQTNEGSQFYFREKVLERYILSKWCLQQRSDYEFYNEHKRPSHNITFYIGGCLTNVTGWWNRLVFRLRVNLSLIFNWLSFVIWGYGESLRNIVLSMIGFILIFTGIYLRFNVFITGDDVNFGDCLYYSFITFVTLGFGNINPVDTTYARLFVSIEGFIGIILIALFILTLSRKLIR